MEAALFSGFERISVWCWDPDCIENPAKLGLGETFMLLLKKKKKSLLLCFKKQQQ